MTDIEDPPPRDRLLAGALVVAPVLLLASTVAYVVGDGLGEDLTGGAIQVWAAVALGLAMVGLAGRLASTWPRAGAVLTLTAAVGAAGAVAWGIDSMVYAGDVEASLSGGDGSAQAGLALFLPGLVMPFTLAALGVGVVRTGLGPRAAGVTLTAGALCFPVSRIGGIEPLALVADLLIAGGMVPLGLHALRGLPAPAVRPGSPAVAA